MLRRLSADTATIIGCALSWGVAVGLVRWLDGALHLRAFAWTAWEVVPVGAFLCGIVAGSGGFIGIALSRMRPTPLGVLFPALAGASIPIAFYLAQWTFGAGGAGPAPSESVPLARFLGAALSDPVHHASVGVVALQFLGAFAGGALTSAGFLWTDACPRCHELMVTAGALERYVDDPGALARMTSASLDEPAYVSMLAALEKRAHGFLRIRALLKICRHCGMGEVIETRRQRAGDGWGRPAIRRKYGSRAPALVRWFMAPVNGAPRDDGGDAGTSARAAGRM